jgi:hypothetical protein
MALCTNSYARATSQFSSQPATTELTNLLEAASDLIEDYCDRTFASTAYTEKQDGNGLPFIYAKNPPSVSFTSIVITDPDNSTETILAAQFRTRSDNSRFKIEFKPNNTSSYDIFPEGFANVTINYTGGYATVPDAVQRACVIVALNIYRQTASAKNPAFSQERMGDHGFTRAVPMDPITGEVKRLLSKYAIREFG